MERFFDPSEILKVLQGFNPWWTGRAVSVPEFRRLAYQPCEQWLTDTSLRRAVLLSGPRRVGKTTLLMQLAGGLVARGWPAKGVFYVSLDHPLLRLVGLEQILDIFHSSVHPQTDPAVLLLDEVQYAKSWETEVKLLVDHRPQYRILATGSASVVQRHRIAESGVGRWVTVPIPTLSFYEFVQIRGEEPPPVDAGLRPSDLFGMGTGELAGLAAGFRNVLPAFQRYLLVGGFPETARQEDVSLCQRLLREDVVERVLKRDMTALFGVRNVNELEKLFIYLCLHTGGIVAHKTCADALGTSPTTVANHLALLEQANLVYRVAPAGFSGKQVLKAKNKYYLVDAALRNAVLLRGEEILGHPEEMGVIVETAALRHLFAYYYRDTPEILYWRDARSQKEVDIIVRSPAYVIPVEVKYREDAPLRGDSGLAIYCAGEGVKRAYQVTKSDADFAVVRLPDADTQFLKVPAHIFLYLLGQAERQLWTG